MDENPFDHWLERLDRDGYLDAELILRELFVHLDTEGRPCRCGCHPSLGSLDTHGGEPCPCTRTPEERSQSMHQRFADIKARREAWEATDEGRTELARRAVEKAELEAWIAADDGVEIIEWGGCCPEPWLGSVDGRSFYFRERWADWSIELDLQPTGTTYTQLMRPDAGDPAAADRTRQVETEQGDIIAEGPDSDLGVTPLHHGRFIANTVRAHLPRQGCPHPGARRYWPECGTVMAES